MPLPQFTPMPLARLPAPFDHPAWIFELKYDGFRALAYVEDGRARFVSRNGNTFKFFPELTAAIGPALGVTDAVPGRLPRLGDLLPQNVFLHLRPFGRALTYSLKNARLDFTRGSRSGGGDNRSRASSSPSAPASTPAPRPDARAFRPDCSARPDRFPGRTTRLPGEDA